MNNGLVKIDEAFGIGEDVSTDEIVISKVWIMQGLSNAVIEGQAKIGELRDSVNNKLYAAPGEPFEVLMFMRHKLNEVFHDDQFFGVEMLHDGTKAFPEHAGKPWKETINDVLVQRNSVFNFFCLPVLKAEEMHYTLPLVISMRKTSIDTAKALLTTFKTMHAKGLSSTAHVVKLRSVKNENEKGKFFTWGYEIGRASTQEEIAAAYVWYKNLREGLVKANIHEDSNATSHSENVVSDDSLNI